MDHEDSRTPPTPAVSSSSSKAFYDSIANDFRVQDEFWDNPYDREIWRLEHELIRSRLEGSKPLLDLGCGFYPHFEFAGVRPVVAGDISFRSLAVAAKFGDESGLVRMCQFDVSQLPFKSNSCSAVIAGGELLNHLDDYRDAVAEIARVLGPGGILLLQVGGKWCLDSLWAILDSLIGGRIGYAMTRREAWSFFVGPEKDPLVTWDITSAGPLAVRMLTISKLRRTLESAGLNVVTQYGANTISGLVPLPIQQDSDSRAVRSMVSLLIRIDRLVGRLPPFRSFAGNVFIVCRHGHPRS